MPSPALLNTGREEGGEEVEVFSDCDSSVLPFNGSLGRGGRELRSCFGRGVVWKNLTCTRGKLENNNREVPGLSIQWKCYTG